MIAYELEIACDLSDSARARAWIDSAREGTLDSEFELPLERFGSGLWRASFGFSGPHGGSYFYRLGIVAEEAGSWRLRIREGGSRRLLFEDGDQLMPPKTWILGSFDHPRMGAAVAGGGIVGGGTQACHVRRVGPGYSPSHSGCSEGGVVVAISERGLRRR